MRFKKVSAVLLSGFLGVSSFMGCSGSNSAKVEFNPKAGDEYKLTYDISMDTTYGEENMSMSMDMLAKMKFSEVTKDNIKVEATYDDLSMSMNLLGQEINVNKDNPQFAEIFDELTSMKLIMDMDLDGNIIETSFEGADGLEEVDSLGLSTTQEGISNELLQYNDFELKEGEEIEIPVDNSMLQTLSSAGVELPEDFKIKGKVVSVNDDEAVIKIDTDEFETDGVKCTLSMETTIDLNVGMTSKMTMEMKMTGNEDGEAIDGTVKANVLIEKI